MEMCYNGALVMPSNCVVVESNEMEYINGGWSATVTGSLNSIRNRLTGAIAACIAGNAVSIGLGLAGEVLCKIAATVSGAWFTNVLAKASTAHNTVEGLIRKYGKNRRGKMTSTWAVLWCTGISVSV